MSSLNIRLLGDFSLELDGEPLRTVNTPRLQAVLAYLLLQVAFKDALPTWVSAAKTKDYLDQGAKFLERLNPEEWLERGRKAIEDRNNRTTP